MRNRSLLLCCFVLFTCAAAAGQDAPPSTDPAEAVKLNGNETVTKHLPGGRLLGTAIYRQEPEYPVAAKQQRISGAVVVEVTVDESGKVIAARKWRFTPTRVNGEPVKVVGTITFNFNI